MTLTRILRIFTEHGLLLEQQALDGIHEVKGKIRTDNRLVEAGDIFVCIKGLQADGHSFIPDARAKQVALIVCQDAFTDALPAIRVSDTRKAAALLAKLYYHDPSSSFRLIGITGTNGKTTTSMLLFKALRELGFPAGWIGTLGYYINDRHYETRHTTPDIMELNQIFADMAQTGVKYVCMEVSSHALALDRVYGIEFDLCLFTNLTREHLDFHANMEEYGATKMKLFEGAVKQQAVALVNRDDSFGKRVYEELLDKGAFVFSIGSEKDDFLIRTDGASHGASWDQSRFALQSREGIINIRSPLIGKFNIANLAMSAAALSLLGFEPRQIEQGLNSVQPVRGRFERVPNQRGIGVFVDYAHTPDALENVLRASRDLEHKRILCLLGAGGDRDKGKRPLMLKATLQFADAVVITDDNPRTEDPDAIIRDIVTGSEMWLPWWVIRDRKEAIRAILRLARPGDVVLLCGKGHETYQEIGGVRHHFDDAEIAATYLESDEFGTYKEGELALPVDPLLLNILYELPGQEHGGYHEPKTYLRVSTDSRNILPYSIFYALKGVNFDGNNYLEAVMADTTNLAVGSVDRADPERYVKVADPLAALASLCRKYLLMFGVYKIALTGSTGKSSTKELLAQVCGAQAPTLKTAANENNLLGLCRTILRIRPEHHFAILELGTNAFGEIATLSEVCAPDAGIIINIGPSHLEYLIDEDGVFQEKSALFNRPLDIRLYDADDPRFADYARQGKGVGFGENSDFRLTDVSCDECSCSFKLNGEEYRIPYPVPYFAKNAAFAIATGTLKGIPQERIREALTVPIKLDLRLQLENYAHCLLLADCYNANPVSMQSAIDYWRSLEPGREHVAILGDMLELGDSGPMYHSMIGTILAERGIDRLFTVGELASRYHTQDSTLEGKHFAKSDDLLNSGVLDSITPGAVVLVKGSHSIHLEKLLPRLRKGS
jgi:UDP-N-acetylmuramyl-tripeptide synthetase/UDP-N-acetylmuramoyl-tripeptide--D-alanyl-D-alanine ligase